MSVQIIAIPSKAVLVSATTKGLGKGLLMAYLDKRNRTIIAANRDPEHASSKALRRPPAGYGSCLIIVKVDAFLELTRRFRSHLESKS
ncbi:hypothetical protein SLS62_010190 [Diatrype stigma]|uniref:Uncharacterized protein n=1 Tax=Diatrype stigma TaxID=117547 RepID=A0AAN9UDK0_9PEZI